jgi:hypothetical protein
LERDRHVGCDPCQRQPWRTATGLLGRDGDTRGRPESKGLSPAASRRTKNGAWEVELAGGTWKAIQSPYLQVLGERHALRDAMAMFDGGSSPYLDATVVFAPTIPPGSQLSSDFKVAIRGLDELPSELSQGGAQRWPLDKWEAFARHHRLTAVPDVATARSPMLAEVNA